VLVLYYAIIALGTLASAAASQRAVPVDTLASTAALPAHLIGPIEEMTACEQTADGRYFIFDRRSHSVFTVPPSKDLIRKVVDIGAEAGRVLRPTAFDLADDGTFVVADAPGGARRVQVFHPTGASLGGFTIPGREVPLIVMSGLVLSGIGSVEYTGRSVLMSQPDAGALVIEYGLDGRTLRTFGTLRSTGQEQDRDVHLGLNAGLVVINPRGGFYYVFLGGVPLFRKYDAGGALIFERHIEGVELDDYVQGLPSTWPRRRSPEGRELPLIRPAVQAAAADAEGNLWISLAVPFTYVYDSSGDKRRVVQFRAAGIMTPGSLTFTRKNRPLVSPGCYTF
jgi:hypothetical protein